LHVPDYSLPGFGSIERGFPRLANKRQVAAVKDASHPHGADPRVIVDCH
jgi:hypothetical protein